MAVQNGTALLVKVGGTLLSCQTDDTSLSLTKDMIETTCKGAAGGAKTYIPGEYGATIDVNAAYDIAATNGFSEMFANIVNGTEVAWTWGSTASTEKFYEGHAFVSDLSISAPQNDKASYSFTLQVTGEVAESTNP